MKISNIHNNYVLVNYQRIVKCKYCNNQNYNINIWSKDNKQYNLIEQCCYNCAMEKIKEKQIKLF